MSIIYRNDAAFIIREYCYLEYNELIGKYSSIIGITDVRDIRYYIVIILYDLYMQAGMKCKLTKKRFLIIKSPIEEDDYVVPVILPVVPVLHPVAPVLHPVAPVLQNRLYNYFLSLVIYFLDYNFI